ncbi:sulfatase [Paenibacillus contaminans]|nr:sulfatase [Paenibacillus contaminans]
MNRMTDRKPNILFVFPDQWRKQAVGFLGEDPVMTPNIDRFAKESMFLDNAISCFPLCSPNRSSMLTGRYPLSTGVTTNCKLGLDIALNADEKTIGNMLKDAGYATGYIGKWHLDLPEQNREPEPASGARHWDAYTPPGEKRYGFDFWYAYNAYDRHLAPHYWKDTPEMIEVDEWSLQHETDVAASFIRNRDKEKPFALFVSWNPPHQPFGEVPDRYKAMYADMELEFRPNVLEGEAKRQAVEHLRDYYAAVTGMDEQFGRLLGLLREEGIEDDTIVVLTSDHGELMGAHDWTEHKNIWYEEAIVVPCMFRWPGKVKSGRDGTMFNSVDLVPTLLGLADLPVPDRVQGTDLSAVMREGVLEPPRRANPSSAFICHYPGALSEHREAAESGRNINAFGWRGVRTAQHTYVVKRPFGSSATERLLYDNMADPYQLSPKRIDDLPADAAAGKLEGELRHWLERIGDPFMLD